MLWFDGSIKSAVDNVKSSGIPLLIFVRGDDELSNVYDRFLSTNLKLKSKECIALKIEEASVAFKQFKEIYYSVPVPSIFFIQNNGIPLKIISSKNTNDIGSEINNAFGSCFEIINGKGKAKEKQENVNKICSNLEMNHEVLVEDDNKTVNGKIAKSSYAKNVGHNLFDVTEDEIKKRLNEIRSFPQFLLINNHSSNSSPISHPISKTQSARIQFRLPNNALPSWEFPDLSTLADVRAYLMEKADLPPNFKLLQACPRRGFTPQDEQKTLVDLSLTPNAILIVIPVQDKTVQARVKNIVAKQNVALLVLETLLQPFLIFIKFFKKHVLKIDNDNETIEPSRMPSDPSMGKTLNKTTSTCNII